jgi:hypothetical protein
MRALQDLIDDSLAPREGGGRLLARNPLENMMKLLKNIVIGILAALAAAWAFPLNAWSQPAAAPEEARDGQHDFDFNFGTWKTHIKRILDPLSGSSKSIELNGTVTVRKVWDGRAQLEEIEADGPNGHWQGMTLFLYNPQAHQWNQSFVNSKSGLLTPPLIGAFKDGRGELFASDTINDRSILVRGVWSDIKPDSHHFEESYSDDGGKTWAPAFIATLTREKP